MENQIKEFYDATADKVADEWYKNDLLMPSIEDFVKLLPENPRILDLGCGPGHESMRLAKTGAEVVGIDFSDDCIRLARKLCPQCKFEVMDFRSLDKSIGSFDGVFACASLIHVTPDEMPNVVKGIRQILKPNGYLAVTVLDGEGIKESWSVVEVDGKKFRRPIYLYTFERLLSIFKEFSFIYIKDGYLDRSLKEYGWKYYFFKLQEEQNNL